MKLTTGTPRAFEFGCQSAACAPPNRKGTGGSGGSIKGQTKPNPGKLSSTGISKPNTRHPSADGGLNVKRNGLPSPSAALAQAAKERAAREHAAASAPGVHRNVRKSRNPKLDPWLPVTKDVPKGAPLGRGKGAYTNESPRNIFQPPTRRLRRRNNVTVTQAIAAAFHKIRTTTAAT